LVTDDNFMEHHGLNPLSANAGYTPHEVDVTCSCCGTS